MDTMEWLNRTALLVGEEGVETLQKKHVLIVGLGGVGAYAAEMLCRAGIGELTIVDADVVEKTNLNRQLLALHTTIGEPKVKVMKRRLLDINPNLILHLYHEFLRDDRTLELLKIAPYDYVVDAIDTLSPKVFLLYHALQCNLKVVSAMGAGGKLDPALVKVSPIEKTTQCRLAYVLRKRLHHLGVYTGFKAVYSTEKVPQSAIRIEDEPNANKLSNVGTISYMPALFGLFATSVVIQDFLAQEIEK